MIKNNNGLTALGLSLVLGILAIILAGFIPVINSIILGLFFGIIVGNVFNLAALKSKIGLVSNRALEFSLVFLAFGIQFNQLGEASLMALVLVVLMIGLLLVIGRYLSRRFKCTPSTAALITFGTAICGSSAIAALSPTIAKNKDESGVAIAVVNLLGTIGMILLPLLLVALQVSEQDSAVYIGASLHSVGNVAGAAYTLGEDVGNLALTVKMSRVALLSPFLIIINLFVQRKENVHWRKMIKLPWYLIAFILISTAVSFINIPGEVLQILSKTGNYLLTLAMVAIGLNMSLATLWQSGRKGLMYGTVLFIIQLLLVAALMFALF